MEAENLYLGTSGWVYPDWNGRFYPEKLKANERLKFYASHLNALEINASFYRLPSEATIASWNQTLGDHYHLVVKGSQYITHDKRLQDIDEALSVFLARVNSLKSLKIILWQLPPSLGKDRELLVSFLEKLPPNFRYAIEFRHTSWWSPEVVAILRDFHVAFVAVSHPKLPEFLYDTTDFLYLRFHGLGEKLYDYDYSYEELFVWAKKLRPYLKTRELFVFFNNCYHTHAIRNGELFKGILGEARFDT